MPSGNNNDEALRRAQDAERAAEAAHNVADAVMRRLEVHENVCGERYKQIVANQNLSTEDRSKLREMISERFKSLYGFLWGIAFSIIGFMAIVVVGLIAFIANNGIILRPPAP